MNRISRIVVAQEGAPLPKAWGVLYAGPNANNSRKSCSNCWKWCED